MLSLNFEHSNPSMNMLSIAAYPTMVEEFLPKIKRKLSKPQLDNFYKYLTGLIISENKAVAAINNSFVGHYDQSALNNWLTDSLWDDDKIRQAIKAPKGMRPIAMIPIGYPNEAPAARSRRPVREIMHKETF